VPIRVKDSSLAPSDGRPRNCDPMAPRILQSGSERTRSGPLSAVGAWPRLRKRPATCCALTGANPSAS